MIDKIIVSSDENPNYISFWPIVAKAYKKLLNKTVHLALVSNRKENDPYIAELQKHGEVTIFEPASDIPLQNQGKIARHYLAAQQNETICYIDDIDLIPLSRDFIINQVADRPKDHLLCVGADFWAYGNNGCFGVSQMTAEGYVFKQLWNPKDLSFHDLMRTWIGLKALDPIKEDISNGAPGDELAGPCFSDEYLIRYLRSTNKIKEFHKTRGYDWETQTADRGLWNAFDQDKLNSNEYVFAHCERPYGSFKCDFHCEVAPPGSPKPWFSPKFYERLQPIIEYIDKISQVG